MKGGTASYRSAKALFGLAQDEHRHHEVQVQHIDVHSLKCLLHSQQHIEPWHHVRMIP